MNTNSLRPIPFHYVLLVMFVLLACSACQRSNVMRMVEKADSLLESSPDSAYRMLASVSMREISGNGAKAHYLLAYNQARYKLDRRASVRDLDYCVDYYKKKGNHKMLLRAYYYRGAINEENGGQRNNSISDFMAAEHLVDSASDALMCCRIYNQLAGVNIDSWNEDWALYYAKKDLEYARKTHDADFLVDALNEVVMAMRLAGKQDSAHTYIQECLTYLPNCTDAGKASIYNAMALYENEVSGDWKSAEYYHKLSWKYQQSENTLLALAELYFQHGMAIEGKKICERLLRSSDKEIIVVTNDLLKDYYLTQKDYQRAFEALEISDSLVAARNYYEHKAKIDEIQQKYDYNALKNEKEKMIFRIVLFSLVVVLVLLVVALLALWKSHRRMTRIVVLENQLSTLKDNMDSLKRSEERTISEKIDAYRQLVGRMESVTAELEKKYKQSSFDNKVKTKDYNQLVASLQVFFYVMQNEEGVLTEKENRTDFINGYKYLDSSFWTVIEQMENPSLTKQECLLTVLWRIEKTPEDIRLLMGMSRDAYKQLKSRTLKKLRMVPSLERFCNKIG